MVSKNNAKMVQRKMADQKQKFGIRKLSVGVASVLLGTLFYMQSGTVYADVNPVASDGSDNVNVANEKPVSSSSEGMSSPSNSAGSDNSTRPVVSASDAGNSTATSQVSTSPVESTASQVSDLASAVSGQESSSSASQVNMGTDNIADRDNSNEVSSSASVPNSQASTDGNTSSEQLFSTLSLPTNQTSAVKASSLLASKVALTGSDNAVNGGFDSSWGILDVNNWQGNVQGDYYQLTDYTGDADHVIVPNEADFEKAGISTSGKQVGVTSDLMHTIFRNKTTAQDATIAFSKTDNKQVKAIGADWSNTWGHKYYNDSKAKLSRFDGTNLDVSNVTNMSSMFFYNQISDLSPLANWKTDNVTDMSYMFGNNQISDVSPLANWKVDNVTDMSWMFDNNATTQTKNLQAKRVINFVYPTDYTGKKQDPVTQTVDVPQKVNVELTTNALKPSRNILDWVIKTETPEASDPVYFQDYTVPEIKGLLEPDKTVIAGQQADITKPINVTVTYKLVDSNTNDAFALDSKNGLHEHADVNDNGGYDKDYWGALDVSKFTTVKNGDNLEITGYTGDASKVIIPNITDFEINNLDQGAKQVTISSSVMHDLAKNATRIGLSKTGNQKVVARDAIWQDAFGGMTNEPNTSSNANGGMWVYNPNLTTMDLHNLDTTNITNMSAMFNGGRNLNVVGDLSDWNTANVASMKIMFQRASSLTNIGNLNNWDTSKVTDMTNMFNKASKLTNIGDLSKWQTGNVTDMNGMFANATNLTNIGNLDNWNTSKVTDMSWMFGTDTGKQSHLTNIGDLSKWQTGNVTDMHDMFANATNLTNIGDLSNWDTSKVTDMSWMFGGTTNLTNIGDLSKWQTGNVTDMHDMFLSAKALRHLNISNWNLTKLANKDAMKYMFANDINLTVIANDLVLPAWYQNEINDSDYFWNNHMAVITNVPELIRATGDIDNLKIDDQDASRSIFYDSKGSSDALEVLKQADQDYIKQYQQTHPGYALNLAATLDQTDPIALANAEFTSTANDHQISIEYVDNATGQVVKTDHVSGKTGQTVSITPHVPDSWELVSGQSVPSEVTLGADGAPVTVIKVQPQERSVAVKFVDDQSFDPGSSDGKTQVGQAVTVTGRDGDTVNLNLTVPDKYQLADGQQLPTTYTFAKGSGDLTIHLVHKVVQREATIDVQLMLITLVRTRGDDNDAVQDVVTQTRWKQLGDDAEHLNIFLGTLPVVGVGTLTGHVNYDLVDETVVSLKDDWTSLNLSGHSYQLPNGTEIVNGIRVDSDDTMGNKLRDDWYLNRYRKWHHDVDPDYITRPWHGYLSVNETNNERNSDYGIMSDVRELGLQAGLVGDEPNALTKAIGDRAATSVKISQNIDLNLLQGYNFDFSEQDGQLRAKALLPVAGVYIPYVEKTATRTINVTTPDGKTTTVKQTATLAKQVDFGKDAHPAWTTGEWASYEVPTIPGYTASQSQIAKETVTGETKDQTIEITYTANPQTTRVNYMDTQGKLVHTTTVNGQTNQTVDVPSEVPTGWKLVDGQTVPNTITFGPDGHVDTSVKIEHRHVTVTPDKPQTNGTKLPDNLAQSFHGVEASDLNKTVTRTIKVTTPDGQTNTIKQTVKLTRNATVDEVTGDVNYGDWSTGKWDAYTVPTVKGYTATQTEVAAISVNDRTTDQTVDVTYTPDAQKLNVKFIDDTTGQVLKTVIKTGVTNANADYSTKSDIQNYESQHYILVSDSSHGANLVFDNDDSTDQAYEVHLKHGTHPIDEHHTITQTVHYTATDHAGVPDDHTVSVQFARDGYHDEVTGDDHWNAWKQGDTQTFAEVPTPKKAGYTPDKPSVPETVVRPLDHNQTLDVTYTPDTQKVIVTFIDDTDNGKTLKTVTKTGPTNSNAGYTTGDDINMYKGQHYVLVSDQTNGQSITFDTDTNADQRYEVHLKHATHQINDHRTITETVHYKMADGTTAPADHTAKIEFSRDGFNDEVTGADHWNAWTPSATHQFDAVHSPAVKGYTPNADQVNAVTVNPDSQNIERTVTYTPDAQKLDVTFIDDTTGEALKTVVKNGVTHADTNYSTKSDIQNYESQHYVLVSDSSKGAELVFDNDDAVDQHYVVHLKHNTHAIDEHRAINETVHYKMSDGTKAPDDYQAEALSFSRDGFNDEVTGIDHWNAWAPKAEQTFGKVVSPLVAGYTPDIDQINTQTVKPTDHDLEFTVTYTPNVQIAHVKYIDDTDHKVLTQDDLNGRTGETSGYHTTDRITEFKGQHYVFVSDNYPATGMTFDNNDRFDQIYEVHFKHGTRTDEQDVQVPRTIKYVYQNGQQAQPDHSDALSFHETKVVDLVDSHTVSDDWTPAQDFETVMTPAIQGYTPDHISVTNTGIAHDHSAIVETVTYNPDAQKAVVKYIDDTTGKQLESKDLAGVSDKSTGYTTKETIDGYINQHYVLVSDGTDGKTVVFDHDDDADQAYAVHLKHGTEPANESRIKKITVHYQYADGLARSGKAHDDKTATNLTFKRTGTHDLVTDKIAWNEWDHADQTFSAIDSPAIDGYTPDRTVVDNVKVNPESHDLTEVTVTYNADSQKLSVDFIDDTTGKTLKTVAKTGYSDEDAGYNTKADIQDFVGQHYDLVSDATKGENLVFDHDDSQNQVYNVHLSHHTHQINEQHTITETVHYQYADGLARSGKAADDFNANALTFSRDGFNDEVTGIDHWNAWTPSDQQIFDNVQSPVIEGYTPDQSEIGVINVVPTNQNIEKTVTYTADAQKLTVNFIDDVTGQTLKTVAKTGYSDEDTDYNTTSDIQDFVGQHYDLVSDATNGENLVFDHNDGVDQVYDVHFTHHLTPISDHQVVNETIHYVYADGLARTGKAADDYAVAPLEFNRTGKHDDVTGTDSWNAWIPGSANFATVQSPAIQGYTPDHAQIDMISVDANSQDIVKTITYSADQQKMTVDFIDDTDNGKVLKTVTKTGGSDEEVGYNTKADIQTFVDDHYKLDHDTSNGENLVFDHDDAVDQHYEVHLTHETVPINEATSTSQVIHYQLADGTPVAKDYTAKVDFSRDGFKDLVTNADHWNAWTPNATQTFDVVVSPAKAGYTPDHAQVDAVTVEPHHADLKTTVTYSPDDQKATVKYIDDVTGKTLRTKELTGVSDETSAYTTELAIKQYASQHYKLVSDQTNGKPVAFDHDDGNDQTFEVHLTHTYQSVSQEHQVHQTIHYQYADGKKAQPDYTAKVLAFSRTGIQDLVTENIQWNAWTPDQTFAAVNTPALNGYTPDVQMAAPVKVSHDSKDIEQTVIYNADDQTILVNYIDDDTQSTLKTDSIIGKTAQTSDYTTKKSLDQYKGQHYDVVSDDTNGGTLKFDSDSTKVQTYNVHLKHQHQGANDKSTVHQTVHYVYQDGKQAAKDYTATPIEFTRTGDTDLVTGKITWNAWTPDTGTLTAVISPAISGYTPSRAMIDHVDVHAGDKDLDTTVTYVPDRQVIVVNYIDQTTGKTLKTDTLNGLSDQTSGYTTKSQIDSYLGQYYTLISDATAGQTLTFDHDDQATQTYDVVLSHQTEAAHRTHEVHETVDYVYADGSQASKSFTAKPLVFSQTGVHDLVTNTINWNGEWTKPQVFASVESPKITGFTASKLEVKAVNVNYQSSDIHELVIYAANAQTAQIKYIDDVTGKTLEVDGANGHFNESIIFSYNVNDQINKFKQAHYKLVSNNFAGQKYQADNTKNQFEVHLTHEYQKVHATDAVAETVKFQYADGSQAGPTKTQTVNFGRDGIKDLVTGTTAWMPVDSQTLSAVDVPALDGYTADTDQVPAVKVNFGDNDITNVVTYTANDQVAEIKIIDDTTGNVLNTQSATGKFGTEIQFKQNPDQQVIDLQAQHYELVSDNFNGQKYQTDNVKNQFEIHVKHQMMDVQRTDKVTETIHYLGPDGNKLAPDKTQTITFTRHGVKDQVTDHVDWNPVESQEFKAVKSPVIDGYQADAKVVDGRQVLFGDQDVVINVHYTKLPEQKQEQDQAKQPGINLVNTYKVTPEKIVNAVNGTEQKTKQNTVKNSAQSTTQDTKQLPQTGNDEQANLLSIIGGSLMASLALFGLGKKKKHKN